MHSLCIVYCAIVSLENEEKKERWNAEGIKNGNKKRRDTQKGHLHIYTQKLLILYICSKRTDRWNKKRNVRDWNVLKIFFFFASRLFIITEKWLYIYIEWLKFFFIILLLLRKKKSKWENFSTITIYIQMFENNKNPRDVSNLNGAEKEEQKI